jgi:2-polyprenyl-3-methyl-5-hydroxy-6-metoxy-1,4-benzoquinol methylase
MRPKPGPAARFWNRHADRYARSPVRSESDYQAKMEHIRSLLRPDMEVLEFGCGTGSTALALAGYVKRIHATDISTRMIEIAREKARLADIGNVHFEPVCFEDCAETANTYDVIMGNSILHLMDDYGAAIAKVSAMLKPGGYFISSTTCLDDDFKFLRLVMPLGRLVGLMPPVAFFTEKQLVENLQRAGFSIAHQWKPARRRAVFIVAVKSGQ